MKSQLRSSATICREIVKIQKLMDHSKAPDFFHLYGARQALEWVLRNNTMAASAAFKSNQAIKRALKI